MAKISEKAFIAEGAVIKGDVEIADHVAVLYNSVIRGDVVKVVIGEESNVQDCCMISLLSSAEESVWDTASSSTVQRSAITCWWEWVPLLWTVRKSAITV